MARLAAFARPPLTPASPSAEGKRNTARSRYGGDKNNGTNINTTCRTKAGNSNNKNNNKNNNKKKMEATRSTAPAADDDLLSLEGDQDANSTTSIEDYDLGFLDDMACGVYKPISKLWGVKAIAGLIGEQCTDVSTNQSTDDANDDGDDANPNEKGSGSGSGKAKVNSSLLQDSGSGSGDDQSHAGSRRSITSSSFSEVSGDVETTTSINTSVDIDVSADLDEIARRQADLLYTELARTKQEVLLQKQRSLKKTKQQGGGGGGGIFKKGLLGHARLAGGASRENPTNTNTNTNTTTKSRRILSLRKDKNSNSNSNKKNKNSNKNNKTELNASADRPVLAVVNDSGIDLVNVSLQSNNNNNSNNNSNNNKNDDAGAGAGAGAGNNDESAKAVNISGSTAGTSSGSTCTATYSATLCPEGMDTSIDLVVKTGPANANDVNKPATAVTTSTTTWTSTVGANKGTDNAKGRGATPTVEATATATATATSAQAKLDAIATATDDALARVFFGPAAQAATAQAQYLVKAMQEDARRYYQEAIAAERGGDVKGAQKWYGLASMAQEREAAAKTMGRAEAQTITEAEQSFVACGMEVQMAPSTIADGRSVGSTAAFDEDEDGAGSVVSITSNDYNYDDGDNRADRAGAGAGAADNKGTGIGSDLGLGGITSFGGGEASTAAAARTPAYVHQATTTATRGAKSTTSTSFTMEDPTFVLEMSSIDEMMASFSDENKPEASQQEEKPAVSQMDKNKKRPAQPAGIAEDEPPLERSEFVTPVFNLLVRAYGAENFSGDDRWERVNVILDRYKGREDRLIQSLLTKAAEREAKQKEQKQMQQVGGTGNKAGAETIAGTPSDSFQLDVSSIAPEAAATSAPPSEAPPKPDLSFRDLATRPVDDDDSLFGDLEQNHIEPVDNGGPSPRSPPNTVNAFGNHAISPPPNKSAYASSRGYSPQGKAFAPKTPSTVGVNSDSDCSPAHNTSMQSNDSSSAAFDFGDFASSNPFKRLDFAEHADGDTYARSASSPGSSSPFNSDVDGANYQFGYTHEYAAGSQKSGGFTSMVDSDDEQSSSVTPMRLPNHRRAGRASTRLRSILQGGSASVDVESASLLHK